MANKKISQLPQVPLSALTTSDVMAVVNNGITKKVNLDDLSEYINTDNYTSGVTLNGSVLEFNRTNQTATYSVDLSSIGGGGASNYVYLGKIDFNLINNNSGATTFNFGSFAYSGIISDFMFKVTEAMDVDPITFDLEDIATSETIGVSVFNPPINDIIVNHHSVSFVQGLSGFTINVKYMGMSGFIGGNTVGDIDLYVSFKPYP
jgi:hypothetical protein